MAQATEISWCDLSWNPVRGCTRVSAGCDNCYAIGTARRFDKPNMPYEGLTVIRQGKADWSGKISLAEHKLLEPLHIKKPQKIFVNSMSDLFHHGVPDEYIDKVFAVMALCPQHTFLILTKRPERMQEYLAETTLENTMYWAYEYSHQLKRENIFLSPLDPKLKLKGHEAILDYLTSVWPLKNVWLGVSVENQATADERIPILLQTPAAVRWISAEPLLGPLDVGTRNLDHNFALNLLTGKWESDTGQNQFGRLDWVVVGGESGTHARSFDIAWARSIITQCKIAGVSVFVKQLGSKPMVEGIYFDTDRGIGGVRMTTPLDYITGKGGDPSEWPEDLRVREYPGSEVVI